MSITPLSRRKNVWRFSSTSSPPIWSPPVKLQKDSREFIELLNSHGVEFLVVGGHAVAFHGHPRFTGDIDFWMRPEMDNAARLLSALRSFGFEQLALTADDFTTPGRVVQLGHPPNRIDLLTSISGVTFEAAWAARETATLDGLPVFVLGWRSLIDNKLASGRPKDLSDIAKLEAVAAARKRSGQPWIWVFSRRVA